MRLGTTAPRARHVQTENFACSSRAFLSFFLCNLCLRPRGRTFAANAVSTLVCLATTRSDARH